MKLAYSNLIFTIRLLTSATLKLYPMLVTTRAKRILIAYNRKPEATQTATATKN
jgi:hypothetical protein